MSHFNALALRPRTTRALAIALAVLTWAVLAIVMAQPASAISSKKADAKAMKILKTKSKKEVVLFRDKRLLRPSDRVTFATRDRVPVGKKRYKKLGRAAWLYWQDMAPYARFEHPSEMLLLDKKTGKVLSRKKLTYYPLVNGKRPAYLRSTKAYANKRYRVYERLAAPAVTVDLSQLATTSQALPSVLDEPEYRSLLGAKVAGLPTSPDLPATAFQNDCVLMLGELHDDQARRDFTAIAQFGARAGIRTYYATKKGVDPSTSRPAHNRASEGSTASLTEDMRYLVDEQKCLDVMIYASGHGSPASGRGSTKRAIVTMTGPITTRRGKRQETKRRLTSTTLKQVVAAFPTTTFKFKIDACFSGRFTTELANSDGDLPPNNLVIETSSAANQVSYFGFEAQWAQIADSVVRENANELRAAIEERGRAMVVADVADLLRGELGRSVPNTNRISEFTHGNIAGMTSYIATRPAGQTLIGGSELATMINESKTLGADADQAARLGWTTRQSRVNPNPLPPVTAVDRCAAGFGWRGGDPSTQIGEFTLTCGGISPLTMVDIIGSAPLLNFDPHPGLIPNCTLVGNGINCTGSAPPEGPVTLSVFPASPGQSFNVGAGFGDGHAESWLLTLP